MKTTVSIIVPTKGGEYLKFLLDSLRKQEVPPDEVVLVTKNCNIEEIKQLCRRFRLKCKIIEQSEGYFTHALNLGKKTASGDILIFTDDDAITPPDWIKKYIELFSSYPETVGSISSRDVYFDIKKRKTLKTPDDYWYVKLYRWTLRPILEPSHPLFKKYSTGVYITTKYTIAIGRNIPNKTCYSLPFKGVNMAFRKKAVRDIWFIEHEDLKRGFGNEQHFGVQLLLKGYDSIYVPNNPVYHIWRESLSRGNKNILTILKREMVIVAHEIKALIESIKV